MKPTASAYEVAVEFIHLGDILRLWQALGWEPTLSLLAEMAECRYRLDHTLLDSCRRGAWTATEWNDLVRKRLITPDSRPLVAGL